jgi:hypothetical protein
MQVRTELATNNHPIREIESVGATDSPPHPFVEHFKPAM